MFDFGAFELLVVGIVALVVIGPKELPGLLRQIGMWVGKMRRMASEFQEQFTEAINDSEMGDIKKDMEKLADDTRFDMDYDPVEDTEREIRDAMEGSEGRKKSGNKDAGRKASRDDPDFDDDPDDAMVDFDAPARNGPDTARKPVQKADGTPDAGTTTPVAEKPADTTHGGSAINESAPADSSADTSNNSSSQPRSGAA